MKQQIKLTENELKGMLSETVHTILKEWFGSKKQEPPKQVLISSQTIDWEYADELAADNDLTSEYEGAQYYYEGVAEMDFEEATMPKYNKFCCHIDNLDADMYFDYGANYYFCVKELQ